MTYLADQGVEADPDDLRSFLESRVGTVTSRSSTSGREVPPLRVPLADVPKKVRFLVGEPSDIYGLSFIQHVIGDAERSVSSWLDSRSYMTDPDMLKKHASGINELRFLAFVIDVELRDAVSVKRARSGSSLHLDMLGRRLLMLDAVLGDGAEWELVRGFMAVGAVKSSYIPVSIKEDFMMQHRRKKGRLKGWV